MISSQPLARICRSCEILEREARIDQASWGGYIRHNARYRRVFALSGELLKERFLFANDAIMMYSPLLPGGENT